MNLASERRESSKDPHRDDVASDSKSSSMQFDELFPCYNRFGPSCSKCLPGRNILFTSSLPLISFWSSCLPSLGPRAPQSICGILLDFASPVTLRWDWFEASWIRQDLIATETTSAYWIHSSRTSPSTIQWFSFAKIVVASKTAAAPALWYNHHIENLLTDSFDGQVEDKEEKVWLFWMIDLTPSVPRWFSQEYGSGHCKAKKHFFQTLKQGSR